MDCWIKSAASVWRGEKNQRQEWEVSVPIHDAMFSFLAHYVVRLTYMQEKCSAAAFISERSKDYGSMQGYELCMGYALWYSVHPHP